MTPKQKAQNLIDKFTPYARIYPDVDKEFYLTNDANQCALIAVDEILLDRVEFDGSRAINDKFWLEVKKEIKAL